MELTELKRVQNTGELPEYSVGKVGEWLDKKNSVGGTNLGAVSTGAVGVLDMAGSIGAASKFNRTADDLLRDAGTSQQNIGGVGYTVQNGLDDKQIESEVSAENTANTVGLMGKGASTGAAIGSLAGPVGGVIGGAVGAVGGLIGGLFGGGAKKREMKRQMRLAEIKRINTNTFNRSGALTTVLQNNLAQTEGNQESQVLYAADGKPRGGREQNAWGSNGEWKIEVDASGNVISDERLGTGVDNKDTVPIHVNPNTIILPNKKVKLPGGQEIIPSRYYEKTGDINGAEYLTAMNIQNKKYKNGKLPGFENGAFTINNILGNAIPAIASFARANEIKNQALYQPNSESLASNPGIYEGLRDMDQRINSYHILPNINDILAKGFNQINNVGGVGGGQRNLWRLDAVRNAMDSMADQFRAIDQANAQFKQQLGQTKVNAYSSIADRAMKGRQFDDTLDAQEHGAQTEGWSSNDATGHGLLGNMYKGFNDYYMWKKSMDYFENEQAEKKADREAKLKEQKNNNLAKSLWTGLGINPYLTLAALQNTPSVSQPEQKNIKPKQAKARAKANKTVSKRPFTPFLPEDAIWNSTNTGWVSGGRYVGIK